MEWITLEGLVADVVLEQYSRRKTAKTQAQYLGYLHDAAKELYLLGDGRRVNYDLPCIGTAYALWYHMRRSENIVHALEDTHRVTPLPTTLKILDVGSGTGSAIIGALYWAALHKQQVGRELNIEIYGVEPSTGMRSVADRIMQRVHRDYGTYQISFRTHPAPTLTDLRRMPLEPTFDVILYSYTFDPIKPSEHSDVWADTLSVANALKQDGRMLFLTPQVDAKLNFRDSLVQQFRRKGYGRRSLNRNRNVSSAREQPMIGRVRDLLHADATVAGIPNLFGATRKPTYQIDGEVDMFSRDLCI